eukprot:tig00000178_g12713.t1
MVARVRRAPPATRPGPAPPRPARPLDAAPAHWEPADSIWLMPETSAYGGWPQSGEIDVAESYGNAPGADPAARPGTHVAGSTLHWGPPGYSA